MQRLLFCFIIGTLVTMPTYADVALDDALRSVYTACVGIDDELSELKKMAGINTAVTAVGTVAGTGAAVTGFVKAEKDKKIEEIKELLNSLAEVENASTASNLSAQQVTQLTNNLKQYSIAHKNDTPAQRQALQEQLTKLNKQSKNLGNWRTGLVAGATVTNVAGAVIAGNNKVDADLFAMIDGCKASVKQLENAFMQARVSGQLSVDTEQKTQSVIKECGQWSMLDLSPINNRAQGAMISGVMGAGLGLGATVFSAIGNRDNDNAKQAKNYNTAANWLSVGTTAASATATVFNATQIKAIKSASDVAVKCQEALK